VSSADTVGLSNPKSSAVLNLSILCGVPASAALPKGQLLFLV